MRPALTRLAALLALALLVLTPATPASAGGGPRVRVDPRFPPLTGERAAPRARAYPVVPRRPVINCDVYGRCWRGSPGYGRGYGRGGYGYGYSPGGYGYVLPPGARPPGWADDLPYRAQGADRFYRPRSGVVCDRGTAVCYKNGRLDKSETRDVFGERAGDRADDLRDDRGTARLFVPERGVTCDRARQVCFDDGNPDSSLTRRYFGQRAAGAVN